MSKSCDDNLNIYDEDINEETTLILASRNLESIPEISNKYVCMLYLQDNKFENLPDDFFPSLPSLMWLDLRNNRLVDIPKTIQHHPSLTHLLLQNNHITSLPDELGTVVNLKVLQLSGNPISYPPAEILSAGVSKLLTYLHEKYFGNILKPSVSDLSDVTASSSGIFPSDIFGKNVRSYNSVLDGGSVKDKPLSVQFSEKDVEESDDEPQYAKTKGKCPKYDRCRTRTLSFYQSSKYLKPLYADNKETHTEKIKRRYLKEAATKKHKDLLAQREKILQDRKNIEVLQSWRKFYKQKQLVNKDGSYKLEPKQFPYDTNPEYMTLLSREDIEKDLPDKYRKKLVKRSKPSVPRRNISDVHLALKIKQLFENLESINLNGEGMTPRTEQKVLLNEIQKITEIKQKLKELSTNNTRSVTVD